MSAACFSPFFTLAGTVCRKRQAPEMEGSSSSSAIRRRLAQAAAEGRQLGPSGRCPPAQPTSYLTTADRC